MADFIIDADPLPLDYAGIALERPVSRGGGQSTRTVTARFTPAGGRQEEVDAAASRRL